MFTATFTATCPLAKSVAASTLHRRRQPRPTRPSPPRPLGRPRPGGGPGRARRPGGGPAGRGVRPSAHTARRFHCCYRPFKTFPIQVVAGTQRLQRTSSEKHTPHLRPPGGAHVHFPRHPPPSTIHLTPRYHSLRAIHLPHSARSTSLRAIHLTGSTSATRTRRSQPDATCSGARLGATGYDVDTACARRRAGPWASSTLALRRLPAFIVGAPHAPPPGR